MQDRTGHKVLDVAGPGANYQLITDNLLDLSHAQYVHALIGNSDSNERNIFEMKVEGNTVWAYNTMPNEPLTKLFQLMWRSSTTMGDRCAHMRWDPPCHLMLDVGFTECGRPTSEGPSMPSAHIPTPETETATFVRWFSAFWAASNADLVTKVRGVVENSRLEIAPADKARARLNPKVRQTSVFNGVVRSESLKGGVSYSVWW